MEIPQPLKPRCASALGQPLALLTYPLQILGAYRGADPLFDLGLTYFIPRDHIKLFHDSAITISHHPLLKGRAGDTHIIRLASDLD